MKEITLTDVLEGYACETPAGNDQKILQKWIETYPQFANDLTDFAAARAIVKFAPEEEISAQNERRYEEMGLKNLRTILGKETSPQIEISSLADLAKAKGFNKAKFASAIGLSLSLLMYLEKKRLEAATIPRALIKRIADALETGEEIVSAYLSQPLSTATQASFKTASRPSGEAELKSFTDAVREDQTLSAKEKNELLQLK